MFDKWQKGQDEKRVLADLSLVELWGFEPQTSSMPWKRATNCAIAPRTGADPRGPRGQL